MHHRLKSKQSPCSFKISTTGSQRLNRDAQRHPSAQSTGINRRQLLIESSLMVTISQVLVPFGASSRGLLRSEDLIGPEIPQSIADYFLSSVHLIQREIGPGFNARLAIYGVTKSLPSGTPGDPAKDYNNKAKCGTFTPPSLQGLEPYQCCSQQDTQDDMLTRECCRHYAYCVPYDRFPARPADSVSTVVLSSRVFNASDEMLRGIISHELGHAIDFHIFGKKYRLQNRPCDFRDEDLESSVHDIDLEKDPEYRADMFADLFILGENKEQLCYNTTTLLQSTRSISADCTSYGSAFVKHFRHRPIQSGRII